MHQDTVINSNIRRKIISTVCFTYNSVCMDLLAVSASASCFARPPLDTTPRFRFSCASERDSDTPRHTRPKSLSDNWQPRTDNSLTLFSFRLSQMSRISAPDSASPVI